MVFVGKTMVFYASVPLPFVHPSVSSIITSTTELIYYNDDHDNGFGYGYDFDYYDDYDDDDD